MVRESNSPGASAPTVLAGLRLCRTAHHPCQCFSAGHTGQASMDPSWERFPCGVRGVGRIRTSGVSLSQIYSLLPSPLGHTTGASLLPVTVRCVPCPIHLSPQTVSLHKLMGDGSGSWSCRESNSDLACCQPLLAVTCVGLSPLAWGRSSVDGCVRRTRTACRRCSCTGRANPSSDCPTSPIQSFPALTR